MRKVLFIITAVFSMSLVSSCDSENTTDQTYEINAIDKDDVEDPDDRGNS